MVRRKCLYKAVKFLLVVPSNACELSDYLLCALFKLLHVVGPPRRQFNCTVEIHARYEVESYSHMGDNKWNSAPFGFVHIFISRSQR
jgi:hypothetical protein